MFTKTVFVLSVAFTSVASAVTYQTYEFQDGTLNSRPDLADLAEFRDTEISEKAARDLVRVRVGDVHWTMKKANADILERFASSTKIEPVPEALRALADGPVSLDRQTLASPRGQIRVMLKPLLTAGIPSGLLPIFSDPVFVSAAQAIAAADSVDVSLTREQKIKFARLQAALMWRLRGGGLYEKTAGSPTWRILFTQIPMNTLASLGGLSSSYIGQEFVAGLQQSWSRYFDIGRFPNQEDRYHDLAMMVKIGSRLTELSARDLEARGFDASPLRIAGRQFGGCFDAAWDRLATNVWGDRTVQPFVEIANIPTQWAELCAGLGFGSALVETLSPE